jgi:hypothetical protein
MRPDMTDPVRPRTPSWAVCRSPIRTAAQAVTERAVMWSARASRTSARTALPVLERRRSPAQSGVPASPRRSHRKAAAGSVEHHFAERTVKRRPGHRACPPAPKLARLLARRASTRSEPQAGPRCRCRAHHRRSGVPCGSTLSDPPERDGPSGAGATGETVAGRPFWVGGSEGLTAGGRPSWGIPLCAPQNSPTAAAGDTDRQRQVRRISGRTCLTVDGRAPWRRSAGHRVAARASRAAANRSSRVMSS